MSRFPLPPDETPRLEALRAYEVLDTAPEAAFERLTALAARLLGAPIALVSLVDVDRQWFKSACGLDVREMPRRISFCTHAILGDGVFVVPDATLDPRFADNPLVTGPPGVRFYAGAPLITPDGRHRMGTLCVLDHQPRELSDADRETLRDLAMVVVDALEFRRETRRRERAEALRETNEQLEQRVAERTADLDRTAGKLRAALEENDRLVVAIQSASLGVIIVDTHAPDQPITFVNPAFLAITGYSRAEVLGRNCRILQGPETDPETADRLRGAVAAGQPFRGTLRNYRRDGTPFWNEMTVSPVVPEGGGRPRYFIGTQVDVTARREGEERLRLLESVVVNANDAVIITEAEPMDEPGPRILYTNQAFEHMTGYLAAEAHGRSPRFLQGPDTASEAVAYIHRALRERRPVRQELINYRRDGTPFWVDLNIVPVANEQGRVTHYVSVQRDITEHKQAERDLRRSESHYRRLFSTNPLPTWVYDLETLRFLEVNPAAIARYGYSREEFLNGLTLRDIRLPEEGLAPEDLTTEPGDAPPVKPSPWRHRTREGHELLVEIAFDDLTFAGRRARLVVVNDVTERAQHESLQRAKDAAERANAAKSEFLSTLSHELRTPLNAILGFGQLLELEPLPPPQVQSVEHIMRAGRHLLGLIDEVLDIARIESGHLALLAEAVPLGMLLRGTLGFIRPLAAERNLRLRGFGVDPLPSVDDGETGAESVRADPNRLKQILLNLLANAVKYNRDGGEIELRCVACPPPPGAAAGTAGRLRLTVRDTGMGLTPEEMARLFIPFERLGAAHGRVEGTGLGLAVSQRLAEAMGGTLGVESTPGVGSTFWVELPRAATTTEPGPGTDLDRAAGNAAGDAPAPVRAGRRLLYIEDNPSNLQLIQGILERQRPDWHLLITHDGVHGLELARSGAPDLILLDRQLPGLTGDAVLARLHADPHLREIPVILLSADANPQSRARLLAAGARAYLTKPLNVREFLTTVDEVLADHAPRVE